MFQKKTTPQLMGEQGRMELGISQGGGYRRGLMSFICKREFEAKDKG